ncbi:hypothetical protein L211DRAFT_888251 [Terfezia boudieri ATCC MYA-4762]|uniref:Uncharacterized protein n=1 Tax=Terfezia boudieri ATCC MYA-4762 TaxID=1051890 RepID=A0A3N4LMA8_9PEZI|nr:hypothetical protein L211DRAFT_888251 [Terfezia boudieri ATCC MYA-4762]
MRHIIHHAEAHPNENPYESINLLHALCQGIDAWKTGVKTSSLEHCFAASQVKIHGPFLPDIDLEINDMPEVEEEILECIHVVHPGLQLSRSELQHQFISPPTEVVEDLITDIENALLATYLPAEAHEPEAEAPLPPPLVTPHAALSCIESLLLFSLQGDPSVNTTVNYMAKQKTCYSYVLVIWPV